MIKSTDLNASCTASINNHENTNNEHFSVFKKITSIFNLRREHREVKRHEGFTCYIANCSIDSYPERSVDKKTGEVFKNLELASKFSERNKIIYAEIDFSAKRKGREEKEFKVFSNKIEELLNGKFVAMRSKPESVISDYAVIWKSKSNQDGYGFRLPGSKKNYLVQDLDKLPELLSKRNINL